MTNQHWRTWWFSTLFWLVLMFFGVHYGSLAFSNFLFHSFQFLGQKNPPNHQTCRPGHLRFGNPVHFRNVTPLNAFRIYTDVSRECQYMPITLSSTEVSELFHVPVQAKYPFRKRHLSWTMDKDRPGNPVKAHEFRCHRCNGIISDSIFTRLIKKSN